MSQEGEKGGGSSRREKEKGKRQRRMGIKKDNLNILFWNIAGLER